MDNEALIIALSILATLLGSSGGVAAIRINRNVKDYKSQAEDLQKQNSDINRRLILQIDLNDKLELNLKDKDNSIAEISARLTILDGERENERIRHRSERDDVMKQYGGLESKLKDMQKDVQRTKDDLKQLRDTNRQLEAEKQYLQEKNVELETVRKNCERLTDENKRLVKRIEELEMMVAKLRNPPPTPPASEGVQNAEQ
jgi:DNA repair exonuclease SbcCD ATPase subunit